MVIRRAPAGHQCPPACLHAAVPDLIDRKVGELVIERGDDGQNERDRRTIYEAIAKSGGALSYRHSDPHAEAGLWAADAIVWAFTAGGAWRRLVCETLSGRGRHM